MSKTKDKSGRAINREKVFEYVSQYLIHGEEMAADILGIKPTTLRREIRRAKSLGINVEQGKILRDIE